VGRDEEGGVLVSGMVVDPPVPHPTRARSRSIATAVGERPDGVAAGMIGLRVRLAPTAIRGIMTGWGKKSYHGC
jgi:hypothetical protein